MAWELVLNEPLRVVGDWPLVGAHPVAQAIQSFAVPILVRRSERLAPLATGALFRTADRAYLITAAHALEAAPSLAALVLPIGDGRRLALTALAERCTVATDDDVAIVRLRANAACRALLARWRAFGPHAIAPLPAHRYVICGYPVAQSRWVDGQLHSKPVTFYTHGRHGTAGRHRLLSFARVATRADACDVYTPPLEGVSGATAWHVVDEAGAHGPQARVSPAGVQISYRHGDYVRIADWQCVADSLARFDAPVARDMTRRLGEACRAD